MTKAEAAPAPPAEGQAKPNLAKGCLSPDSTVYTSAESNNCSEWPEKRRRSDRAEASEFPQGSEYPFEDGYPSEPRKKKPPETESEADSDNGATTDSAEQLTATDTEHYWENGIE